MKNKIKFIGIIAFVAIIGLLFVGCGGSEKEGTFELKNETGVTITAYAMAGTSTTDLQKDANKKDIEAGKTGSWTLSEGDGVYSWIPTEVTEGVSGKGGTFKIEKGKTATKSTKD
jgi:hypothetical protein